jgi:hypothetical protein
LQKTTNQFSMKTRKVSISFSNYTDANLENKAEHILASMTGNPAFADPIPTLAQLQDAVTAYSNALVAAAGLGKNAVAEKNKSRKNLEALLKQLGMYVMYVANGDIAILTSSGYTLTKEDEPRHITNPGAVTLTNGITSGEMVAAVKTVQGASSYVHEITTELPTNNTVWTSNVSTRSRFTYRDLEPGKKYWVRVAAVGRDEQIAYSPVTAQFVQ